MKDTNLKQLINLHSIDKQLNLLNEQRGELPTLINDSTVTLENLQKIGGPPTGAIFKFSEVN